MTTGKPKQPSDTPFSQIVLLAIQLLRNIGRLVFFTLLAVGISRIFDPHPGILTLMAYVLVWIAAFFYIGLKTPAYRWAHLFAAAAFFLFLGNAARVKLTWQVSLLLLLAVLVGGVLSEWFRGRRMRPLQSRHR